MSDETTGWVPPTEPSQTVPAPPSYTDGAGVINRDLTCRRCGYNLRGLREEGRCPECGSAVGLSTRGNLLQFADPDWVSGLARGGRLVMRGLTVAILAAIVFACSGSLLASTSGTGPAARAFLVAVGFQLILLGAWIAVYCGIWLITSADPSGAGEDTTVTARKVVRLGILGGLLSNVVNVIQLVGNLPYPMYIILQVGGVLGSLFFAIGWLAYLRYTGKLAGRIPDEMLVQRARQLFRLYIAAFVVLALVVGMIFVTAFGTLASANAVGAGLSILMAVLGCGMAIFWLVLFLMYVRFQHRLGKAFEEQAAYARDTWASECGGQQDAGLVQ